MEGIFGTKARTECVETRRRRNITRRHNDHIPTIFLKLTAGIQRRMLVIISQPGLERQSVLKPEPQLPENGDTLVNGRVRQYTRGMCRCSLTHHPRIRPEMRTLLRGCILVEQEW